MPTLGRRGCPGGEDGNRGCFGRRAGAARVAMGVNRWSRSGPIRVPDTSMGVSRWSRGHRFWFDVGKGVNRWPRKSRTRTPTTAMGVNRWCCGGVFWVHSTYMGGSRWSCWTQSWARSATMGVIRWLRGVPDRAPSMSMGVNRWSRGGAIVVVVKLTAPTHVAVVSGPVIRPRQRSVLQAWPTGNG